MVDTKRLHLELTTPELDELSGLSEGRGKLVKVSREVLGRITRDYGKLCNHQRGEYAE